MPIEVVCDKCGAKLRAPDHAVGRSAKCPQCGTLITVPSPAVEVELIGETDVAGFHPTAVDEDNDHSAYRPPVPDPTTHAHQLAPPPSGGLGDDLAMRMLLPVGRSWLAIVAGYLGLFSLICFPAPLALVFGILAIVDIRRHPHKHGMGRAIFGVVMGVLGTIGLVLTVIAMMANLHAGRR